MKSRKITLRNLSAGQQWRCRHREKTDTQEWVGSKVWDQLREQH